MHYTSLLYERLIAGGALRRDGKLPPVLPIVIYNGSRPWTAAEDVAALIAGGEETAALARYQPSQRYYLLDEGRTGAHDLPGRNLVSALIALETNRQRERTPELLAELFERLRESGDPELRRVFQQWVDQVPAWRVPWDAALEPQEKQEVRTMLAETAQRWRAEDREWGRKEGRKEGRNEGRKEGIAEERSLVCRMAARKFAADTAPRLSALLEDVADPERLAQVGEWIIECETGEDLLARVRDAS